MASKKQPTKSPSRGGPNWRPVQLNARTRPSFFALSAEAKLYWMYARILMHSAGLDLVTPETIGSWASLDPDRARAAESELITAGEAARDGALLWLVFACGENTVNLDQKTRNHRTNVKSHIAKLPQSYLVRRFAERYPEWWSESEGQDQIAEGPVEDPADQLDLISVEKRMVSASHAHGLPHTIAITENREQKPATYVAGVSVPQASTQDSARPAALPKGAAGAPVLASAPPAPLIDERFADEDGAVVFDAINEAIRDPSVGPYRLLNSLPPPATAAFKSGIGSAARLLCATDDELARIRERFTNYYRRARAPAGDAEKVAIA